MKKGKNINKADELEVLINSLPDALYILDMEGQIVDGNISAEELLGYKKEELIGKSFRDAKLLTAKGLALANDRFKKNLKGKATGPDEYIFISKKGEKIPVEIKAIPIRLADKAFILGVIKDMSSIKSTEKELEKTQINYRLLFDNMVNGFAYHKIEVNKAGKPVDYTFLEINKAFEKYTGIKKKQAIGRKVTEVLPGIEKDPADWIGRYGEVALKGKPIKFEQFAEPLKKWFSVYAYSPEKGYFATIFEDITEHKEAEDTLKESEKRFRDLANLLPEAIYEMNLEGKITFANKISLKVFGYTEQDYINGFNAFQMVAPEELPKMKENIGNILKGKTAPRSGNEYLAMRKDKSTFPTVMFSSPIMHEGKAVGIRGIAIDITERKKAENEIVIFKKFAETSSLGHGFADLNGDIIYANSTLCRIAGVSPNKILGTNVSTYYPDEYKKKLAEEVLPTVAKEGKWLGELPMMSVDGKITPTIQNVSLIKSEDGEPLYFGNAITDITELKQAEEKLKNLDMLKSRFITALTHVIRTPLSEIRWGLETLLSGDFGELSSEQENFLRRTLESEESISGLITNMNLVLDIERNKILLEKVSVSILSHIKAVIGEYSAECKSKQLTCTVDPPKGKYPAVKIDPGKIKFVFGLLYDNAIKYSPKQGKIVVKFSKSKSNITVKIIDTGIGIPEEEQTNIFERFFRASNAQAMHTNGVGLGLFIAKAIVEAHEGEIGFESTESKGSTFWFSLPISK